MGSDNSREETELELQTESSVTEIHFPAGFILTRIPKAYQKFHKNYIICTNSECLKEFKWTEPWYRYSLSEMVSRPVYQNYSFLRDTPFCSLNCASNYLSTKRMKKGVVSEIPSELFLEYGDTVIHFRNSSTFRDALRDYKLKKFYDNIDVQITGKDRVVNGITVFEYTKKKVERTKWLKLVDSENSGFPKQILQIKCRMCGHLEFTEKKVYWSYTKKMPLCSMICVFRYIKANKLQNGNGIYSSSNSKKLIVNYCNVRALAVNDSSFLESISDLDYILPTRELAKEAVSDIPKIIRKSNGVVSIIIRELGYKIN